MRHALLSSLAFLPLLMGCPAGKTTDDSGGVTADGGATADGGTGTEADACWEGGTDTGTWTGRDEDQLAEACGKPLRSVWVDGPASDDLWNWEHHDTGWAPGEADQLMTLLSEPATADDLRRQEARHAAAVLASAMVAGMIDDDDYPDTAHPNSANGGTSLEWGCEKLSQYAECGLQEFSTDTGELCKAVKDVYPPPAGNDPEDFCADLRAIDSGTNGAINTNHLTCNSTPLSNTLSFIAKQQGAQPGNFWVTVAAAENASPHLAWWPLWMAAYAGDAPGMMLFTARDSKGNEVPGILAVQQIQLQVKGQQAAVAEFQAWIEDMLLGKGEASAPASLSQLQFILPSKLVYRAYTVTGAGQVIAGKVQSWTPGADLVMADGTTVPFVFTRLVGIIDPCRTNPSREVVPTACTNNGLSWVAVVDQLVQLGQDGIFEADEPATDCP